VARRVGGGVADRRPRGPGLAVVGGGPGRRGGDGLNILKYTETVPTVAATSLASEVLRGLGYWYFYDGDELGQWVSTSIQFTQQLWLIA